VEIETGDARDVSLGDVMFADDTTGHGHITRVVGNQPRLYVMIPPAGSPSPAKFEPSFPVDRLTLLSWALI
jgi:hypothetical protein